MGGTAEQQLSSQLRMMLFLFTTEGLAMCGILVTIDQKIELKEFEQAFDMIVHRGPDMDNILKSGDAIFGFHRLSIMDTSSKGMQPFTHGDWTLVCNGEIYNYLDLRKQVDYTFKSDSDCEVLLPYLEKTGADGIRELDAEFAFIAYNHVSEEILVARDPIGIRPLFYGVSDTGVGFASEAKALISLFSDVRPFPPGHYFNGKEFIDYRWIFDTENLITDEEEALKVIHDDFIAAVDKRLMSDVRVGYLLSGGLDSSLVCALAAKKTTTPIDTFAVGMKSDAIDLKYARQVADKIGSVHHEVIMSEEDVLEALEAVVETLETWDITTIRASVGMYLLCKYIHQNTDIKVLLTGEISDELFGYKYTDFAPSPEAFQQESLKRVKELYMYDVLRADRCVAAWSLEARVPFGDLKFVNDVLRIDPALKMNRNGIGKYLLREAFAKDDLLPDAILWREKAAFSDAVGHSMVDIIKDFAKKRYESIEKLKGKYPYKAPTTSESLLYRELFETYYKDKAEWIVDYWMPNKEWPNCDVDDPSARVLKNYGLSGV